MMEQYRTYNLLTGLPRTLTISLSSSFELSYASALDEAISRYNQEDLQIHFQRANGHADIEIVKGSGNWIAASGLPSGDGTAFHTIKLNPSKIPNGNGSSFTNFLATLMAHEMGHCIGFRHTDYMDRSFSCPGRPVNEGSGNLGAVNIPGTPVASDNGSWMLACITLNQNRPFNSNDRIALNYLY
jgi:dual-action HEIGH metallo-peptidase